MMKDSSSAVHELFMRQSYSTINVCEHITAFWGHTVMGVVAFQDMGDAAVSGKKARKET